MARDGMSNTIAELRNMCNAGTADYTLGVTTYWSDNQLQQVLDQYRTDFREALEMKPTYTGGSVTYTEFYFSYPWVEHAESGTVAWRVETSDGGTVAGTADYVVNYHARNITFDNDQAGTAWLLFGRRYDMNRAAAHVWRHKASSYSAVYDVSTDNHTLKRSQLVENARKMALYYEQEAQKENPKKARFVREDSVW
jgi:hypothetical protein